MRCFSPYHSSKLLSHINSILFVLILHLLQMVISSLSGKSRLSLHSAEAHGAGMTSSGYVDIILDRKLMQDDDRGLGQGLFSLIF